VRTQQSETRISRRSVLAGLAALGVGGVTGCGSALSTGVAGTAPGADSLTYWNLFSGGDGVRMVAMEDGYQKSHHNVDLNSVTLSWGAPYYTKLALATLGGKPPDVGVSHVSRVPTLAKANLLTPLDESVLAKHGMTSDKFTGKAWQQAHVDGKLYAIPLDTHPFVLYYNIDVCKKAGLLDSDGRLKKLDGPTAFVDALEAAKKVTGQYGGVVNINADPSTCWRWFATLYGQLGGGILANDGREVDLDEDHAVKVLNYMADLTVKKKLMPSNIDGGGVTMLFSTGKVGFLLDGEWQLTTYQATPVHFDMTPVPNIFGGKYACFADSHTLVLPRNAKRTPDRLDLDLDFIRSLLDQSLTWAKGGHVPAWLPVQTSAEYKALKPNSHYVAAADAAYYDPPAWYSGAGSDFENIVGAVIATVESGQQRPEQAVAQMRSKLKHYANTKPPVA
jgi:multiple sugar transport system substrate-binding protein